MVAYILSLVMFAYAAVDAAFFNGGDTAIIMMWVATAASLVIGEIQDLKRKK